MGLMMTPRSRRSRRSVLATLPAAALVPGGAALAACVARPDAAGESRAVALRPGVTVQALVDIPAPDQPLLERVLTRFAETVAQAPKVAFTIGPAAEQAPKAQAMLAAGTPPDIIQLEATAAIAFIARGHLASLDAYLAGQGRPLGLLRALLPAVRVEGQEVRPLQGDVQPEPVRQPDALRPGGGGLPAPQARRPRLGLRRLRAHGGAPDQTLRERDHAVGVHRGAGPARGLGAVGAGQRGRAVR